MPLRSRVDATKAKRKLGKLKATIDASTDGALSEYGLKIISDARRVWPVDTGYTRRNLRYLVNKQTLVFANDATDVAYIYIKSAGRFAWDLYVRDPARNNLHRLRQRIKSRIIKDSGI